MPIGVFMSVTFALFDNLYLKVAGAVSHILLLLYTIDFILIYNHIQSVINMMYDQHAVLIHICAQSYFQGLS